MPAVVSGGSCIGFYPFLLKPGGELLVYANQLSWTPKGDKAYFTNACAGTKLLSTATSDLLILKKLSSKRKRPVGTARSH